MTCFKVRSWLYTYDCIAKKKCVLTWKVIVITDGLRVFQTRYMYIIDRNLGLTYVNCCYSLQKKIKITSCTYVSNKNVNLLPIFVKKKNGHFVSISLKIMWKFNKRRRSYFFWCVCSYVRVCGKQGCVLVLLLFCFTLAAITHIFWEKKTFVYIVFWRHRSAYL